MVNPIFTVAFAAMGSRCELRLGVDDAARARRLGLLAIQEIRRIEAKYSRYRQDSALSRINAAAGGDWVAVDAETAALLDYADALYTASDGLFDVTSGVLRRAWDFQRGYRPSADELAALRPLIGWSRVVRAPAEAADGEARGQRVGLPLAGMELDFGGIGKEYAVDRAAACLLDLGVNSGYVNLGGDLRILGPMSDGTPWSIGIQHPRRDNAVIATLPVGSGALATSGDYERYFEHDGQRYCHLLDPHTGQPGCAWRSVSVLAPVATTAGSVASIAMLKQSAALAFLDASGLAYLAVDAVGRIHRRDVASVEARISA